MRIDAINRFFHWRSGSRSFTHGCRIAHNLVDRVVVVQHDSGEKPENVYLKSRSPQMDIAYPGISSYVHKESTCLEVARSASVLRR